MIEPPEQFGICWHCNNLMVTSRKVKTLRQLDCYLIEDEYILWEAVCTSKNFPNKAQYPRSVHDRFYESPYWGRVGKSGENFTFNINTCSKYEELT